MAQAPRVRVRRGRGAAAGLGTGGAGHERPLAGREGEGTATVGLARLTAEEPASVGDFKLLGRLGTGGFGTVYLGITPGGRKVAVKAVHRHVADSDGFRARLHREVEALRRAGGFFTALLVDADPRAELPWPATEYVPGPDLGAVVARGGPPAPEAPWRPGATLCEALAMLHGVGPLHRDLRGCTGPESPPGSSGRPSAASCSAVTWPTDAPCGG